MSDEIITKRKVTMFSIVPTKADRWADPDVPEFERHEATDYVRPDFLDAYVTDAEHPLAERHRLRRTRRGPGGYHGATHVPAHLTHDLAGQTFAATTPEGN
jgi:hypothetical protein